MFHHVSPSTLGHGQVRTGALAAVLHKAIGVPEVLQASQFAAASGAATSHAFSRWRWMGWQPFKRMGWVGMEVRCWKTDTEAPKEMMWLKLD